MNPHPQSYYTRKDLCTVLMVSLSTIKRHELSGALKATHVGPRIVRYCPTDVDDFLKRRKKNDPPNEDQS